MNYSHTIHNSKKTDNDVSYKQKYWIIILIQSINSSIPTSNPPVNIHIYLHSYTVLIVTYSDTTPTIVCWPTHSTCDATNTVCSFTYLAFSSWYDLWEHLALISTPHLTEGDPSYGRRRIGRHREMRCSALPLGQLQGLQAPWLVINNIQCCRQSSESHKRYLVNAIACCTTWITIEFTKQVK